MIHNILYCIHYTIYYILYTIKHMSSYSYIYNKKIVEKSTIFFLLFS
nr:MAG TPA: hypothetical protein [Caudoviricetes sp.]